MSILLLLFVLSMGLSLSSFLFIHTEKVSLYCLILGMLFGIWVLTLSSAPVTSVDIQKVQEKEGIQYLQLSDSEYNITKNTGKVFSEDQEFYILSRKKEDLGLGIYLPEKTIVIEKSDNLVQLPKVVQDTEEVVKEETK